VTFDLNVLNDIKSHTGTGNFRTKSNLSCSKPTKSQYIMWI